jgi:pimeloyl-ACP methyl ester carboxylesterase
MKLALLPGLGADARMYGPLFDGLADRQADVVLRIDWPDHRGERTLAEVAERLIDEHDLGTYDVIAGSSLGGMVGAEIVARTGAEDLVLIGSAQEPREVNRLLGSFAKLRDRVPLEHLQRLMAATPPGVGRVMPLNGLVEMIAVADPDFVRAMAGAVFEWSGRPKCKARRHRIHGAWDLVILPPKTNATILPRAGHMIAMTHERQVVDFIRAALP